MYKAYHPTIDCFLFSYAHISFKLLREIEGLGSIVGGHFYLLDTHLPTHVIMPCHPYHPTHDIPLLHHTSTRLVGCYQGKNPIQSTHSSSKSAWRNISQYLKIALDLTQALCRYIDKKILINLSDEDLNIVHVI